RGAKRVKSGGQADLLPLCSEVVGQQVSVCQPGLHLVVVEAGAAGRRVGDGLGEVVVTGTPVGDGSGSLVGEGSNVFDGQLTGGGIQCCVFLGVLGRQDGLGGGVDDVGCGESQSLRKCEVVGVDGGGQSLSGEFGDFLSVNSVAGNKDKLVKAGREVFVHDLQ